MLQKIQYKLFSVMLLAAIAIIGCITLVIQWSFDRGFLEYVDLIEQEELHHFTQRLERFYQEKKSWQELQKNPFEIMQLYAESLENGRKKEIIYELIQRKESSFKKVSRQQDDERPDVPRYLLMRCVLLDHDKQPLVGQLQSEKKYELTPLMYQKKEVGYIARYLPTFFSDSRQLLFIHKQKSVVLLITSVALAITIILSFPLAYHFTRPIHCLSLAARKLIMGDYSVRVKVTTDDEIGHLSHDFNRLAGTLAVSMEHRKRLVSDVAHELRTPLNSLRCEIEAMQDGILHVNELSLEELHSSVMRLSSLVADLKSLSISDEGGFSYLFEEVDIRRLIEGEIAKKRKEVDEAGLQLQTELQDGVWLMRGDVQRLQQLILNILYNSVAYTDRGGAIYLDLKGDENVIELQVRDTLPGVSDEDLPYLCERLYRVEKSRNRDTGGAGLGLAIASGIVEAHQGYMELSHAEEGGLCVTIRFPRSKKGRRDDGEEGACG